MINNIDQIDFKDVLTKKNYKFIKAIAEGYKAPEAYKIAGYKGTNEQQPYQLVHTLKYKISEYLKDSGFNQETLGIELNKLLSLPLRNDQSSVTIDQKIKILRLFKESLPESEKREPSFSRFTIVQGNVNVSTPEPSKVADAITIPSSDSNHA
jgi:hypothetical protein